MEAALSRKTAKKKRKTHTTRGYRKREQEVQKLIRATEGRISGPEHDMEALSLQFFHGFEGEMQQENDFAVEDCQESDEDSGGELAEEPTDSPSQTFIHIDLHDPPLAWGQLFKQRHYYDESLLYRPSNTLHFQLHLSDLSELKDSQIRMLNRYQEQSKSKSGKLGSDLIGQLSGQKPASFLMGKHLYRSVCHRRFQSVFFLPCLQVS